jgi:hypothetical protein
VKQLQLQLNLSLHTMDDARPGHEVEFHGLQAAAYLNGTRGRLIKFLKDPQRWAVRCQIDQKKVSVKPENLKRIPNVPADPMPGHSNVRMHGHPSELNPNVAANSWAVGLDKKDHYEWLCNCYQLRCDDDYQYGGCYLHGPYDPGTTPDMLAEDFLVFCVLAKKMNAIPPGWDWKAFLKFAPKYISCAFEKSDAVDRWGRENYFAAHMGGRSLRFTGTIIYGSPVDTPDTSILHQQALDDLDSRKEEMQEEVGGLDAWDGLELDLLQYPSIAGSFHSSWS